MITDLVTLKQMFRRAPFVVNAALTVTGSGKRLVCVFDHWTKHEQTR